MLEDPRVSCEVLLGAEGHAGLQEVRILLRSRGVVGRSLAFHRRTSLLAWQSRARLLVTASLKCLPG
jgi:hypothetical protein